MTSSKPLATNNAPLASTPTKPAFLPEINAKIVLPASSPTKPVLFQTVNAPNVPRVNFPTFAVFLPTPNAVVVVRWASTPKNSVFLPTTNARYAPLASTPINLAVPSVKRVPLQAMSAPKDLRPRI